MRIIIDFKLNKILKEFESLLKKLACFTNLTFVPIYHYCMFETTILLVFYTFAYIQP